MSNGADCTCAVQLQLERAMWTAVGSVPEVTLFSLQDTPCVLAFSSCLALIAIPILE